MTAPQLGVCYYPEHWPESAWPAQASAMAALGIRLVRIAEFAWSRIEPQRDQFDWAWLDRACDTLADAGLSIILCTPSACPPKWLLDEWPEVYPVDASGQRRGFGSRRHYSFSSQRYRYEMRRITEAIGTRYAQHPAVVGWQTDNEYGCHETTRCYSDGTRTAFQNWLRTKYGHVDQLNAAWGTVFWSQEYPAFSAVELPNNTVTEANPAHWLDFMRFSSEAVVEFNAEQVDILRPRIRARWITHNFMGGSLDFDHFAVCKALDLATWDSYPLGFLDQFWFSSADKRRFRQLGHPDWSAFHHDLYYGVGRGRFGVMEQQPGPVNWAQHNAVPQPGAVRLWTHEAIAHGAEFVSYFRWRQLPFAQEQMHAGLMRVDGAPAPAAAEVAATAQEIEQLDSPERAASSVALVFDYASLWLCQIQPQADSYDPFECVFTWYSALRALGVDVDIVAPEAALDDYALVVLPCGVQSDAKLHDTQLLHTGQVVLGPRSGSKTPDYQIPANLAPGIWQQRIALKVTAVDSVRVDSPIDVVADQEDAFVARWLEHVDTDLDPLYRTVDGHGVCFENANTLYVNGWLSDALLQAVLERACARADVSTRRLPDAVRIRTRGHLHYVFNFSAAPELVRIDGAHCVLGSPTVGAGDVAVWSDHADR